MILLKVNISKHAVKTLLMAIFQDSHVYRALTATIFRSITKFTVHGLNCSSDMFLIQQVPLTPHIRTQGLLGVYDDRTHLCAQDDTWKYFGRTGVLDALSAIGWCASVSFMSDNTQRNNKIILASGVFSLHQCNHISRIAGSIYIAFNFFLQNFITKAEES